ncbi:pyruvate ferredoxin oxidoreductase [candidate division KSB1 bacterium]
MIEELCTANYAGGWTFSLCGNANRTARGCGCGIYPITPQTEIVETVVRLFDDGKIEKGRVFHVESEHSAMATSIGVSVEGARAFTATSSNGALYMAENIVNASLYRLPIVMQIVNRTLGPEWNIWAEQGDSLLFRDWGWIQIYCENNQELVEHILMAFYISENHKILLPSMICVDAFILSHTMMPVLLPTQEEADEYLPTLDLPHRIKHEKPSALGGLSLPRVTSSHRFDMERDIQNVFEVYTEAQDRFEEVFERRPEDPITGYYHDDAEIILVTSSTITSTARQAINERRKNGEKIGLVKVKMIRPFPTELFLELTKNANKIAVLDRNAALGAVHGINGIFAQDIITAFGFAGIEKFVQNYIVGLGGMDVTTELIDEIIEDVTRRKKPGNSIWKGI